jgi:hypothetical protein
VSSTSLLPHEYQKLYIVGILDILVVFGQKVKLIAIEVLEGY